MCNPSTLAALDSESIFEGMLMIYVNNNYNTNERGKKFAHKIDFVKFSNLARKP